MSKIKRLYDIKENVDSTKKELIDETITSCEDKIFDEIREKIPIKNDKKAKTIFSLLALDNLVLDARIKVVNGTVYVTYKNGVFYEIEKVDKDRYQINVYNINKAREEYVDCLLSGKEMTDAAKAFANISSNVISKDFVNKDGKEKEEKDNTNSQTPKKMPNGTPIVEGVSLEL